MARRIILRENGLTGSNPPVGYKFLGFYGLTFSYLESNGVVNSIGGTGSGNVGYGNDGSNSNRWLLTNTTGGSNPGVNNFATDNTDPLSLTGIWIHRFDSYSIDQKPWLDEFQLRLSTYSQYGYLQIKELGSNNVIATYNPTYYNFFMPAFPNPGNYAYIALTPISGGGTFTVGQEYSISWVFNGSNATITADNGVAELSPGVFGLGGSLSQATIIDGQSNNFTFGDLGKVTFTASSFISNQVSGLGKFTKSILQYNLFDLIASDGIKTSTISLNADDQTILDGSTDNRLIINDGNNKGLVYFDDYSANFTTYSLVTKGYVDSVSSGTSGTSGTSGVSGITNANNGLEIVSGTVYLGGTLSQNTNIYAEQNSLNILNLNRLTITASGYIKEEVFSGDIISTAYNQGNQYEINSGFFGSTQSNIIVSKDYASINAFDGIFDANLTISTYDLSSADGTTDNRMVISDTTLKGLVYADDYSAKFSTYSLISKKYVDDAVSNQTLNDVLVSGNTGSVPILLASGSHNQPSFSFENDTNTGLYNNKPNEVSIVTGGATAVTFDEWGITIGPTASTGVNHIRFNRTNTGFYNGFGGEIEIKSNGLRPLWLSNRKSIFNNGSTFSSPALNFDGDLDTGWFFAGNGQWGFSSNGLTTSVLNSNGIRLPQFTTGLLATDANGQIVVTSSSTGLVSVDNALEIISGTVYLGGTLSQNTTINSENLNFTIQNFDNLTLTGSSVDINLDNGLFVLDSSNVDVYSDEIMILSTGDMDVSSTDLFTLTVGSSSITSGDSKGLVYATDYSATFVTHSLVTKKYVDDAITTGTSGTSGTNGTSGTSGVDGTSGTSGSAGTSGTSIFTNVDNGLELVSNTLYLGGTLSQNTTINSENLNFTIQNFDNLTLTGSSVDINLDNGLFVLDSANVDIYSSDLLVLSNNIDVSSTDLFTLTVGSGSITTSDQKGLVYTSDYSATFVTHSLVTKKYVDDEIDTLAIVDGLSIILDIDNKIKISPTAAGSGLTFSNGIFDINVDTTGLTISGDIVSLQNTISGDRVFQDSVTIGGNLTVNGTTSYIYTENLVVEDNLITLNTTWYSSPILNAGIEVNRGTEDFASLIWNESTDLWSAGLSGSEVSILLNSGTGLSKNGSTVSVNINNGLEIVSNNISLGGTLSQNTTIDSDGFNLTIGNALEMSLTASDFITLNVPEPGSSVNQNVIEISSSSNTISSGFKFATWSYVQTESGAIYVSSQNGSALKSQINITNTPQFIGGGDGSNDNFMLIDDGIGNKGLVYTNDYSVNFTTYSLVTKGYVDSQVTSVGATNGLSEISSGVVGLGGTLFQNTTVNASNYGLYFQGNNEIDHFVNDLNSFPDIYGQVNLTSQIYDARIGSLSGNTFSRVAIQNQSVLLECQDDLSNQVAIQVVSTQLSSGDGSIDNRLLVIDDLSNKGIVYAGDYTGNFTTYSLVTKGYVDSVSSGSINATNGLELISNTLYLGGTLSQNTQINSNGYDFTIGNIDYLTLTASIVNFNVENGVYISNNSSNTAKYGSNIQLNGTQSLFNYGQYINVELGSNSGYASYMTVYGPSTAAYTAFYLGIQNGTGNSSWNNHGFKMEMLGQGSYNTGLKSITKNGSFSNISVWGIAGSQEVYAIGDIAVYGLVSEDASLTSFDSRSGYFLNRSKSTSTNYGIEIQNTSTYSTSNIGLWISNDGAVTNNNAIVVDTGSSIFNESGGDYDFRIEGDADQNLFFVDASTDNIGVGNNAPSYKLHVSGTVSSTTGFNTNGLDGWTGTFSTGDSRIATVTGGIITSVV